MGPANALSRWDHVDTTQNNMETSICPEPVVFSVLDFALAQKIQSSTQSNPLVVQAIDVLQQESPLFPHSFKDNWNMTNGHLYFKGQMYIPSHEWQTIVWSIYDSPPSLDMLVALEPKHC